MRGWAYGDALAQVLRLLDPIARASISRDRMSGH
jgi:hypothetical protein